MLREKLVKSLATDTLSFTLEMELRWLAFEPPWKCRGCKQPSAAAAKADGRLKLVFAPLVAAKEGVVAAAVPSLLPPFQALQQAGKVEPAAGVPSVLVTSLPALRSVTLHFDSALALDSQGGLQRMWTQFCCCQADSPDQ